MTDVSTATSASTEAQDMQAIGGLAMRMSAAWAQHSGEAFAEVFTSDATVVLPGGVYLAGKQQITEYMNEQYAGKYKDTQVTGRPLGIRLIDENTGILVTQGGVLIPGAQEVTPEELIQGTWVCVRADGSWLVSAYHNSRVNLPV
jgi:uncharacterized protein (TIGR02246 family)